MVMKRGGGRWNRKLIGSATMNGFDVMGRAGNWEEPRHCFVVLLCFFFFNLLNNKSSDVNDMTKNKINSYK